MSVAAAQHRATLVAEATRADRLLAALPLVAGYLLLATYYAWHATAHGTPWLFSDEIEYAQLSRSIAETGEAARRGEPHDFTSLYSYLLAPVWWIEDMTRAYDAAKYLGAFVMTAAVFPAYWLARMLVPAAPALFAAIGTGAIPALAYSRLLITEVLAYPFAVLCFFLIAKALATWRRPWLVAALAALLIAPAVRGQFMILRPAFVIAVVVALFLSDRALPYRRQLGVVGWATIAALVFALVLAADELLRENWWEWQAVRFEVGRLYEFSVWGAGAVTIGLGVLPVVFGLAALARPADVRFPGYRAFAALAAGALPLFLLYSGGKATYLSTVYGNIVPERNLFYVSPLLLVGTALFLHRPAAWIPAVVAAAALAAYLVYETPYQLDHYPYSDAPGLAVLAEGNRTLILTDADLRAILLGIVAGTLALGLAAILVRRDLRVVPAALGVAAALVVAWNLVGVNSFGNGVNHLGNRIASAVPQPHDWIDRHTGGEPVLYLGQGMGPDYNHIWTLEFWNRSLKYIGSLDYTAPGPGPTVTPRAASLDGATLNDPGVRWVVAERGVDIRGQLVDEHFGGAWRLLRLSGPLRLRSFTTGVYPDAWTGSRSSFTLFAHSGAPRGMLTADVGRLAWGGPNKPGEVTINIGTIRIVEQQEPTIGRVLTTKTWTAQSGRHKRFRIPVRPPFRVELTVDPTFSPTEFGGSDQRQLGVQVSYRFAPKSSTSGR